ncbi:hypothetical protein D3C76_892740 [compost metagenome]
MPAPLQHIHGQDRCIGHLHEENLVAGNLGDGARVTLERQGVETVEQYAEARMIGLADNVPHLLPGIDVTTPGQRFVTDTQASRAGAFGQQAQIVDQNLFITDGVGRGVAAHQHQVGAQLLHQVELALGPLQIARQTVTAAAFEVAEWLKQRNGDPEIGAHLFNFSRAAVVVEKVILEDLHAVETGGGNGFEFFRQGTAQGHGGNGTLHISTPGDGGNLVRGIARLLQRPRCREWRSHGRHRRQAGLLQGLRLALNELLAWRSPTAIQSVLSS